MLHIFTLIYIYLHMSSNIRIPKICMHCGENFIAKTTVTKYCSLKCSRQAWKFREKKEKIKMAQEKEYFKSVDIDMTLIQTKEFLSINEVCLLLSLSRMTLYRYIKTGKINATKIGGKVILKRKDINNLIG